MTTAVLLSSLGNPVRQQIIEILGAEGRLCVNDITDRLDALQANVSRHLHILLGAGAVEQEKEGAHRYYTARPKVLQLLEFAKDIAET